MYSSYGYELAISITVTQNICTSATTPHHHLHILAVRTLHSSMKVLHTEEHKV